MVNKDKRNKLLKAIGLLGVFLLVFGLSYAIFTVTLNGTKKVKIKTGKLDIVLRDSNNNLISTSDDSYKTSSDFVINLDNQVPVNDEDGLNSDGYYFKVSNEGTIDAKYDLYLKVLNSELGTQYIKYMLEEDGKKLFFAPKKLSTLETSTNDGYTIYKLDNDSIKINNNHEYTIKIWVAEDANNEAMNKTFEATLYLSASQMTKATNPYKEGTLAYNVYENNPYVKKLTSVSYYGYDEDTEQSGLYSATDMDGDDTYFLRGNISKNHVVLKIDNDTSNDIVITRILSNGELRAIIPQSESIKYVDDNVEYNSYLDSNIYKKISKYKDDSAAEISNDPAYLLFKRAFAKSTYCMEYEPGTRRQYGSSDNYLLEGNDVELFGYLTKINFGEIDIANINNYSQEEQEELMKQASVDINLNCSQANRYHGYYGSYTLDELALFGVGSGASNNFINSNFDSTYWLLGKAVQTENYSEFYLLSSGSFYYDTVSMAGSNDYFIQGTLNNLKVDSGSGTKDDPWVVVLDN